MTGVQTLPLQLRFEGEFGAEINSFVPFIHWLWVSGEFGPRQIVTYRGMEPFYAFLPPDRILTVSEPRRYVPPASRPPWLPTRDDHAPRNRARELFPDYRTLFANDLFAFEKPLLILHNKFSTEWGGPPVNFLPPDLLAETLAVLSERFQIVYSRPGLCPAAGYSGDHQPDHNLDERPILREFPEIQIFEDLAADLEPIYSYNQLKLMLYANSWFHITVQGGNAHLAAILSGSLILIYHLAGQELRHSYHGGHFAHATAPTPTLLIARSATQFCDALPVVKRARRIGGRVHVDVRDAEAAEEIMAREELEEEKKVFFF